MSLEKQLEAIARALPQGVFTFKPYGTKGRQMATTRTVNVNVEQVPVPGHEGKVARAQITFCVNLMDIDTAENYNSRRIVNADNAVDSLSQDGKAALLAKLAAEMGVKIAE